MSYFHLTARALSGGLIYATCWEESTYWRFQQNIDAQSKNMIKDFSNVNVDVQIKAALARRKAVLQWEKELLFEKVRADEFPDLPSRRNCMFLCESEVQLRTYIDTYKFPRAGHTVVEIELDLKDEDLNVWGLTPEQYESLNARVRHRANPEFLMCNGAQPMVQIEQARAYWHGEKTGSDQLTEVLHYGFWWVKRIVSPADTW